MSHNLRMTKNLVIKHFYEPNIARSKLWNSTADDRRMEAIGLAKDIEVKIKK